MLDTNVVVSAFLSSRGAPAQIFQKYKDDLFDLVVSEPILSEYQAALNYRKVQMLHQLSEGEIAAVIEDFRRAAILVMPQSAVKPPLADKDDIKFSPVPLLGRRNISSAATNWYKM